MLTRKLPFCPIFSARLLAAFLVIQGAAISFAQTTTTVLEFTNQWRYLQATSTPAAWNTNVFDDSSWSVGRGTFAVPADEPLPAALVVNTTLSTNLGEGYIFTHYFRSLVTLPSPTNLLITGSAAIDDGAVIYVNGREARRIAMPNGTISYNTAATRNEEVIARPLDTFTLVSSNFVHGENLIAVEVHQFFSISSDVVFAMKLEAEQLVPPVITTQPADQTVPERSQATFFVGASGSRLRYQWYQNGLAISGATNAIYETSPATFSISGRTFHAVVSNPLTVVTSAPATLTVIADTFGPQAQFILADSTNMSRAVIHFNEPLLRDSTTNLASYSLRILGTTNFIPVTNVNYGVTRVRVWAGEVLSPAVGYLLCFSDVADVKTNALVPNPTCMPISFPTVSNAVSMSEVWRYNDVELGPLPANWMTIEYDDDPNTPPYRWAEGPAAFARSQNPGFQPCSSVQTPLSLGPVTYYFRKRFFVPTEYPSNAVLTLRHMVDDGAVFYLNGQEIYRVNMPAGPVAYNTRAPVAINNADCVTVALEGVRPVIGTNILAVEVHQASETVVDVVFDLEATVQFMRGPELPALRAVAGGGETAFIWDGDGWRLQSATNIFGPWSAVAANTNRFVIPPATAQEQKFFRLVAP